MRRILAAGLFLLHAGLAFAQDAAGIAAARFYTARCIACHQASGEGVPGLAPPLTSNVARHAGTPEGRAYLARVVLTGMVGAITVDDVRYTGAMPSFSTYTDAEIAAVLGHILRGFNGVADVSWATPVFVDGVRQSGGTPAETHKVRSRLTPGG